MLIWEILELLLVQNKHIQHQLIIKHQIKMNNKD